MGVSILPGNSRTPWDLIGELTGQNISQNLPGAIQQGYNRGVMQQSLNQFNPQAGVFEQLKTLSRMLSVPGGPQTFGFLQRAEENAARNKQLADIFGNNNQNQPPTNGAGPQAQNARDFSNISDEALARLSIADPQRANALRQIVQNQRQQKADKQRADIESFSNTKFSEGYKAIQDDDTAALNDIIKDPQTPYDVKHRLSNLKNQHDVRKDVKNREIRTRQNYLKSAYTKAINKERDRLDHVPSKDKPEIVERIKDLVRNQRRDMKKFAIDPESYPELGIWDTEASQYIPDEEFNEEGLGAEVTQKGQKILFNPKNPEHIARAKQVLAEVGGDKAKANAILFEEFDK